MHNGLISDNEMICVSLDCYFVFLSDYDRLNVSFSIEAWTWDAELFPTQVKQTIRAKRIDQVHS